MALNFNDVNGSAVKGGSFYKWTPGENRFRMVGGILPRYMYWVAGADGKNHPFECLGFDRDQERFTNVEMDWVQREVQVKKDGEMVPAQCAWAYTCLAFDRKDGKLKLMPLKKKMTEAIIGAAKKLGDPTDVKTGYDIIVERVKTGSQAFNVEYRVDVLGMSTEDKTPLTADELHILDEAPDITEATPRETSDEQHARLLTVLGRSASASSAKAEAESGNDVDAEATGEFDMFDDDIPF